MPCSLAQVATATTSGATTLPNLGLAPDVGQGGDPAAGRQAERMPEHHDHHHGGDHHVAFDTPEQVERLEREGEVLAPLLADAISQVVTVAGDVGRVLDLGCGPGVGTGLLVDAFPGATVVAVDGSAAMVERATARTGVEAIVVSLPDGLADLQPADVIWGSMVVHHIGDEADLLRRLRALLPTGGHLALLEHADAMQVVADPERRAEIDAHWKEWFAGMRAELPNSTPSAGYPEMLAAAGFETIVDEIVHLRLDPPLDDAARRFARTHLDRIPFDLTVADADLCLHASRHLFIARAI
jgi:trans-aconitate methyltransferase